MALTIGTHALIDQEVAWRVAAGADAVARFTLYDDDAQTAPTDLTGVTGRSQVRRKAGGELLADCVVATGGPAGTVTVTIPAAVSGAWNPKLTAAAFDVELVTDAGHVTRLCTGTLDISPNVTLEEA